MAMRNQILSTYLIKIAIVLLILVVGAFLYLRLDVSKNQAYSVSDQTKQTLRQLNKDILVKVFASRELPPELSSLNRGAKDLLAEFERQSRGKFRFEYVRAKSNEELLEQAVQYGIQPYLSVVTENDRQVSKEVVLGLSFEGGAKSSAMFLRPGMESLLEYQILKQVNKLSEQVLPELAVFADSLALMFQYGSNPDETATFFLELMENYQLVHTDLMTPPKFTPVMLCLGVIDSLETQQLYNLDQYLMRGGKIVMAQDRVAVYNTQQGSAVVEIESNLFRLLEHYGLHIKPNIVLDRQCEIRQGAGLGNQTPYPFFPLLRSNPDFPYLRGFDSIYLYFGSEIMGVPGTKLQVKPMLKTSANSNSLVGPVFQVEEALRRGLDPSYLNLPPLTVAVEASGQLTSFFPKPLADSTFQASTEDAQIILFGDSELPIDFGAGTFIVLNAIDHLLGRDDMLELRSPRKSVNRLGIDVYMNRRQIDPAQPEATISRLTTAFTLVASLGPTLLLALMGILLAAKRRREPR